MVEQAKSGHPGLPLGAAPMAWTLWSRFLRHNPTNPRWPDRDRFLLSAGHGCALLYSLLHLTGYDLPLSELKRFRQWGSKTPGHPEYGLTPGVEATTGPLGQGVAMAVGMAIGERYLRARFLRGGTSPVDHRTYALVSDGDLMEGIASEAASLAGTIGLGKLTLLYDDNHVSLEGGTELAFTESVTERFAAYDWQVLRVEDGNDVEAIARALASAEAEDARPTLISIRTHLGYGSPVQDTREAHGEPLGPENTRATKAKLGWPQEPPFLIPSEAAAEGVKVKQRGIAAESEWQGRFDDYSHHYPDEANELRRAWSGELSPGWNSDLPRFLPEGGPVATRDASAKVLQALAVHLPTLIGGSADLAPSTKTLLAGYGDMGVGGGNGRNIHFGVRENAMVAILNGLAVHGGIIPYGSTFLTFSDYARPAIRIAALMKARSIVVFTHDSVGLGEDGPTHQPVEQLWALRSIPNVTVLRPADANETREAWAVALTRHGPTLLALTRQKIPVLDPNRYAIDEGVARGAYVLVSPKEREPEVVLAATGSEVALVLGARDRLEAEGVPVQVVSFPSTELFDEQPESYRNRVLPPGVPRVFVEAGVTSGWWRYVDGLGDVVGVDRFGASAPGPVVLEKLGLTVDSVVARARALLKASPVSRAA
jgi:transketolase